MDTPTPNTVPIRNIGTLPLQNVQVTIAGRNGQRPIGSDDNLHKRRPVFCTITNGSATSSGVFTTKTNGAIGWRVAGARLQHYSRTKFVDLIGTANGAVLAITEPVPNEINFGTGCPQPAVAAGRHPRGIPANAMDLRQSHVKIFAVLLEAMGRRILDGRQQPKTTFKVGWNVKTPNGRDVRLTRFFFRDHLGRRPISDIRTGGAVRCCTGGSRRSNVKVTPTDTRRPSCSKLSIVASTRTIVVKNPTTVPVDLTRLRDHRGSRAGLT